MGRLALALVLVAAAVAVAWVVQRRARPASRAPRFQVPDRVERADFARPDAPWLVAVFTSETCDTCAEVTAKARALESDVVAVDDVEVGRQRELHDRYGVDAVPLLVVVDREGVVRDHRFGPVAAAELWSTMAALRDEPS